MATTPTKKFVAKYPFLAKYKTTTELNGVIVLVREPHHGIVLYIPTDAPDDDPRSELSIGEAVSPANDEVEVYTGTITISGTADPTAT